MINAENLAHHIHNFAQGGIGMHRLQDIRHGVLAALAGQAQPVESLPHGGWIALPAHLLQALQLAGQTGRIHLQDGNSRWFILQVGIDAYDASRLAVDLSLVGIRSVRDLALEEAFFDGRQGAARQSGGSRRRPRLRCGRLMLL